MKEFTYVVDAKRSAIGSFLGSLKDIPSTVLGAKLVEHLVNKHGIDPKMVDEVIVGHVLTAGVGQGPGRQVALKAGLTNSVIGYSVNNVCGSGMLSLLLADLSIRTSMSKLIFAGGIESMSNAPLLLPANTRTGVKFGELKLTDHMMFDGLTDVYSLTPMGITAENIAEKYTILREEQDVFAYTSQKKALSAIQNNKFREEILPIEVQRKKETVVFDTDEYPNKNTTIEKLSTLRPAFKKHGTVTAGNASGLNDGAAMLLVASEDFVKDNNLNPLAKFLSFGRCGIDPSLMGLGPTAAIKDALTRANLSLKDIDLIELNEAFAAQSLGVIYELSKDHNVEQEWIQERTNVNGGAIALGHPIGASGSRIVTTLIHEMIKRNSKYGLTSLCIGGGMGIATVVENCRYE